MTATPEPDRQWTREIPCEDSSGRKRVMVVAVTDDGRVALHAPAGESAILRSGQLQVLRDAIKEARDEAADRNVEGQQS